MLAANSDRIAVRDLGPTTEGNRMLMAIISSPANLANLEHLRDLNRKLNDPRGLSQDEVDGLVGEGKAVVLQTMSMHSNEVGGTQMAPELAYELVTGSTPECRAVLDNVLFIMVPCFNPDGQIMITDWYRQWLGTPFEGCGLPWLYAKYSGHDNNRDAYQLNLVESKYVAAIAFRDWQPQAFLDHHHQGSEGARLFVPPYSNPVHPHADPLVWTEMSWYGGHMINMLEAAGKAGIIASATYPAWANTSAHYRLAVYHNAAGMHTESASALLATPRYLAPRDLRGTNPHNMPTYDQQPNFPHPWQGGYWHLREIVEQQKICAWAVLDLAARYKADVLRSCCMKARRQTEMGQKAVPNSFVIPLDTQHDPTTARKLVSLILDQGVEVQALSEGQEIGGRLFAAGTPVVKLGQPKMGVIETLLGSGRYPDNHWTRLRDGRPYISDSCTDCMPEFMGVEVARVQIAEGVALKPYQASGDNSMPISSPGTKWILDGKHNESYRYVNQLLKSGGRAWRLTDQLAIPGQQVPPGSFVVEIPARPTTHKCSAPMHPLNGDGGSARSRLIPLRIGLFQRYWGGNPDEGWTRLVLEQFGFDYVTIRDADILSGTLGASIDVLILPDDQPSTLLGPDLFAQLSKVDGCPPEYRSGFGEEGARAIAEFVKLGGRLVTFGESGELAIDALGLKLRDVTSGLSTIQYSTHGSTIKVRIDNSHPLAYGMPSEAYVYSWDSPAYEMTEPGIGRRTIVGYERGDILGSGWLIGQQHIAGKAAMVSIDAGEGDVILIGFKPQNRGQTDGTFKLLFNALYRLSEDQQ